MHLPVGPRSGAGDRARLDQFALLRDLGPEHRPAYAAADVAGASTVYWQTQEYNADARALYDTLARRTSHIVYQR